MDVGNSLTMFRCSICPATFLKAISIQTHVAELHAEHLPIVCQNCGEFFTGNSQHQRSIDCMVHGISKFVCRRCGVERATFAEHRQHILSQHARDAQQMTSGTAGTSNGPMMDSNIGGFASNRAAPSAVLAPVG